jgi:DNA-binding transcriptional LysR family regulator
MHSDSLPHLETFLKAAEHSNFTAAARALGLTQAAVSQRIHTLEQSLGVSLFRRQGGRVLLTEAGKRLHAYAQQIVALYQQAREELTGQKAPVGGELVLAASSIPGEHLLPAVLSLFNQKYPHVQVKATVADSRAVLSQVEHGQAQLGLVGMKGNHPHLEYRSFACDKLVLIVPAGHPWAKRKRITLQQLSGQPLILREIGSGSRWCLEQALATAGKSARDLHIILELGSNEAIKEAVLRGMGVSILSSLAVQKELQAERLHAIELSDLPLKRDMYVVWDRRRVLPIPARLFLDFLEPCPGAAHKRRL